MTETGRYVAEEFYRRRLATMEEGLTVGNYEAGMAKIERFKKINNISHHNMKHYTDTISVTLAEKLKEKGMPIETEGDNTWCPPYAEVFDWILSNGISPEIYGCACGYDYVLCRECNDITRGSELASGHIQGTNDGGRWDTWHEAANAAIEKALELIKE